jgi:hypothetical protein
MIHKILKLSLTLSPDNDRIDSRSKGNGSPPIRRIQTMASKFDGEIMDVMKAIAPMDYNKALILGEAFEVKPKALVAAAKRAGIEYKVKPRVSKTGGPIVTKEDLVKVIGVSLEFEAGELEGLDKATKVVLTKIADAVTALL